MSFWIFWLTYCRLMRRLSPSNFPWLDAWCAVKRRFGSSLATVHKKNRKKVMKSAILKIEPPLERQEDLLFNETKKNCLCLFYTTKMADTKHGKLGRFFFFTAWQILDCEVNFAFISSGFYKLNAFIFQTNECGLLRISLKMDSNFNRTDFLDTWLDARVHFDQWK